MSDEAVRDVIEIGQRLTEAKEIAGHGGWLPWLDLEFGWKERTAQRFINVAAAFASNASPETDLNIDANSLYLLAAPSTPVDVRVRP